ncbi:MotA/TolQ/ExbB proton channel family protein [Aquirufa sp. OSTEICH-129V]|uniref:MotA/TolQ/ExbB proton channel family protein n=1 Tax=Aquirufa avitistagni TaxID=3104728 RepID=A0ABW6DBD6_9BACT
MEIIFPLIIFFLWSWFAISFFKKYRENQTSARFKNNDFWNNSYVFELIPSVFPTIGIFCTALGVTVGIWNFDTTNIEKSIPELLQGLKLAFIATMAGIIGLIIFQKAQAVIQKEIDENPLRPVRQTDELSALNKIINLLELSKSSNELNIERLIESIGVNLELKVENPLSKINQELITQTKKTVDIRVETIEFNRQLKTIREENKIDNQKSHLAFENILNKITNGNEVIASKFDEFSVLLRKNNTEALVEVMKKTTEQFNAQMSELINKLVKENFQELNNSVKNLNDWQKTNKAQINSLTTQYEKAVELFNTSSVKLEQVSKNTKILTDEGGKLSQLVTQLQKVMIDDTKFEEIVSKIHSTVDTLQNTTNEFEATTDKLNRWIRDERNFKEGAQIIINKLEEFRDLNGGVWDSYREELTKSIGIIKGTSERLGNDLDNINAEFYERLNDTFTNLDLLIQRFIPTGQK